MTNNETFIRITNQVIYDEILKQGKDNQKEHEQIIKHQLQTNGKVKLNKWIATTALTLVLLAIGVLANGGM